PIRLTWNIAGASYSFLQEQNVLSTIGRLLGPRDLPYGFMVNFKAGGITGIGGGLTFYHDSFFGEANRFKVRTLYTTTGTRRAVLGLLVGKDRATYLDSGAGYTLRQNARFFGLGPRSRSANLSYFSQETSWIGGTLGHHEGPFLGELTAVYSGAGTHKPNAERTPTLPEVFRRQPFGYGELSKVTTVSVALSHETVDGDGRPDRGGIRRVEASFTMPSGTSPGGDYWGFRGDLEQFLPLWFTERALAFRGYIGYFAASTTKIPFQRLYTNDEPDQLRGFDDYRWRDRGIVNATLEYRWPVWALNTLQGTGVDAYLLSDVGQVFHTRQQIDRRNVTVSYGGGLRIVTGTGFKGRLEIAHSKEETVFRITSDQLFQYNKGDLYNGRDQGILR
ncbi:MAG: hypothetical protein KC729_19045, partial [Candidatus Eisenbacteria bacterium]|nr:hypothetical protein [Candidatus Eisenbacteria bacterium]